MLLMATLTQWYGNRNFRKNPIQTALLTYRGETFAKKYHWYYPNPANDYFQVHSSDPVQQARLYTLEGKLARQTQAIPGKPEKGGVYSRNNNILGREKVQGKIGKTIITDL